MYRARVKLKLLAEVWDLVSVTKSDDTPWWDTMGAQPLELY